MDPVINSQLQSPLARNLQHIASDITTFTYHVEQNAPPLSLHKTLVNPQSSRTGFDNTYNFRIPQYGQLAKMTLKLTYKIKPYQRTHVTPVLPLYHMIDRIDLMSHNNVIETHFGDTIMIKHAYYSSAETAATKIMGQLNVPVECDSYVDIAELFKSTKDGKPFNPFDESQWNSDENCRYVTLFCEVPLSFTDNPAMYLDTRFVEFLDVQVKLQSTKHGQPLFMAAACVELDMGDENIQLDPRRHSNTAKVGAGYMDKASGGGVPMEVSAKTTCGSDAVSTNIAWRWLEPSTGFQQGELIDNRVHNLTFNDTYSRTIAGAAAVTTDYAGAAVADNTPTGLKGAMPYTVHSFAEEATVASMTNGEAVVSKEGASADGVNTINYKSIAKVIAPTGLGKVLGCKHFFYRPFFTRVGANDMTQPYTYVDQPGNMFYRTGVDPSRVTDSNFIAGETHHPAGNGSDVSARVWLANPGCDAAGRYAPGQILKRCRIDDGAYANGGQATAAVPNGLGGGFAADATLIRLGSEVGGLGYVPCSCVPTSTLLASDGEHDMEIPAAYAQENAFAAAAIHCGPIGGHTTVGGGGVGFTQNAHAPGANIYELQLGARPRSRVSNLGPKWMNGFYPTVDADGYPAAAHAGEPRFIRVGAANFDKAHYTVGFWGLQQEDSSGKLLDFGINPAGLASSSIVNAVPASAQRNLSNPGQMHGEIRNGGTKKPIGHTNNDDGTVRGWAMRRANAMLGFDKVTCASIAALWANHGGQYVYTQLDIHGTLPQFATSASSNELGVTASKASAALDNDTEITLRNPFAPNMNFTTNLESRISLGASLGSGQLHDQTTKYNAATYRVEINTAHCVIERFYAQYPYLNIAAVPGLNKDGAWPAGLDKSSSGGSGGHGAIRDIKVEGSSNNADVHGVPDAQDVNLGLLITYLHLHDKVREEVSMDNFKDNMPATILYHDTYAEYQGIEYGTTSSAYAQNTDTSMIIPLRSKHLAYAITVVAYRNKTDQQLVGGDVYNAVADGATPDKSRMDVSLDKKAQRQRAARARGDVIPSQQDAKTANYAVPDIYAGAYSQGADPAAIPLLDFLSGEKAALRDKLVATGIHMQGRMTSSANMAACAVHHGCGVGTTNPNVTVGDTIMEAGDGTTNRTRLEDFYNHNPLAYLRSDLPIDDPANPGSTMVVNNNTDAFAAAHPTEVRRSAKNEAMIAEVEGVMRIVGNDKVKQPVAAKTEYAAEGDLEFLSTAPTRTVRAPVSADGKISATGALKAGRGTSSTHYVTAGLRGTLHGAPIVPDESGDTTAMSLYAGPQIASDASATWPNYKVVENFKTVKPTYVKLGIAGRTIYETAQQTATASSYYSVAGGSYAGSKGSGQWHAEKDLDNLPFHYNEGNNRGEGGSIVRIPQLIQDSAFAGTLQDHMDATVLTFGLNKTDQLSNNGALGLSSATNAQLELKFAEPCRVSVYVHHHATLQIDSNTGVMSRSLDV
jgi:hypothetical protein